MYRRSSGIYAVRICVPEKVRHHFGRSEIHISTNTSDASVAKASAFAILAAWQQRLVELKIMDVIKITEGAPQFLGEGLVRLVDVEVAMGLSRQALLDEILANRADLLCLADGWNGKEVNDIDLVWRVEDDTFDLVHALSIGVDVSAVGELVLSSTPLAVLQLAKDGEFSDCLFWRDDKKRRAIFFDMPGRVVTYPMIFLAKTQAERIRVRLAAGVTPAMLARATESVNRTHSAPAVALPQGKYNKMRASELFELFINDKVLEKKGKPDRTERMKRMCERFVELMDDPFISEIDRPLAKAFKQKLLTLPKDIRLAVKNHGTNSLTELIDLANESDEKRMKELTAKGYMGHLSEALKWAMRDGYVQVNAAEGLGGGPEKDKKIQDKREKFSERDLNLIFAGNWFSKGAGTKNRFGRYWDFSPFYYWMPLLGLYTGARRNELAQLYIEDIMPDEFGGWYIDFNLNGPDKIDADDETESDEIELGSQDKSLKTINSHRQIPLHSKLVQLGLPNYLQALSEAGHKRLFPELRHDSIKGYGKAVGDWFNERYLGRQLKMKRNGKKTFHSFRHTFASGLDDLDIPERKTAQLLGHIRGTTETGKRYAKDQQAKELQQHVDKLTFALPDIAPFDAVQGVVAVGDALKRSPCRPSVYCITLKYYFLDN
jgi:integrase